MVLIDGDRDDILEVLDKRADLLIANHEVVGIEGVPIRVNHPMCKATCLTLLHLSAEKKR